jgi:hypothetical protein
LEGSAIGLIQQFLAQAGIVLILYDGSLFEGSAVGLQLHSNHPGVWLMLAY